MDVKESPGLIVYRTPSKKDSFDIDLFDRKDYEAMSARLSQDPRAAPDFYYPVRDLLKPLEEEKGTLEYGALTYFHFVFQGKAITDFGVILLYTVIVHGLETQEFFFEVLVLSASAPPKIVRVEASKIGSRHWVDEQLGPLYIYDSGSLGNLRTIIQTMAKYTPTKHEYTFEGWMPDGESTYIWKGEKLLGTSWDAVAAKEPCVHTLHMLDVAPHSLTIPLFAVALLSLVQSQMVERGTFFKGLCCIAAPTQSFKTTIAALFLDFQTGMEADTNFEATSAALVRTVGNARDRTVVADDFKPGATKAEKNDLIQKLSRIIRMCSDGSGGVQKAGSQNTVSANEARCLVVVTAEQITLQVQSTMARLLILELKKEEVDVKKLTFFQGSHEKYREFIQGYIRHIAALGIDSFCQGLADQFQAERYSLRQERTDNERPIDNRSCDMVTWLWVSFEKFMDYAIEVGALETPQATQYAQGAKNVSLSILEKQAERVADLNPIEQFFRALQILLETKDARLGMLQSRNSGYSGKDSRAAIGFIKREHVLLKNGDAFQAVVGYYRRMGIDFAISETALRKTLADGGMIVRQDVKSFIHRLYVNGEKYQCIKFEASTFRKLVYGGQENEGIPDQELQINRVLRANSAKLLGAGGQDA